MKPAERTREVIDQERYTIAMMALGFAYGLAQRISKELHPGTRASYAEELDWLKGRVLRVMELNEEQGVDDAEDDAAGEPDAGE